MLIEIKQTCGQTPNVVQPVGITPHPAILLGSQLPTLMEGKGSAVEMPTMAHFPSASSAINTILLMLHIKSTYRPLSKPFPLKKIIKHIQFMLGKTQNKYTQRQAWLTEKPWHSVNQFPVT